MAVTFVGAGTMGAMAANPSNFNLTLPTLSAQDQADADAGKLIILIKAMCKNIGGLNEIDVPSGYTEKGTRQTVDSATAADDMRTALFWKRAVSGDSGATVAMSKQGTSTNLFTAVPHVWRGCITSGDPFDTAGILIAGDATAGDIIGFPAFDPVAGDVHVIYDGWKADDLTTALADFANDGTTFTVRDDQETATGSDATSGLWSADRNGNALGAVNVTATGDDGSHIGYVYALLPAAAGGASQCAIAGLVGA